jgi:hypothetical protein
MRLNAIKHVCSSPLRSKPAWYLAVTGALLISGCYASLYVPTVADVPPGGSLNTLLEGREVYVQKCGSCHILHLPESLGESEWSTRLDEMATRAKLSDREKDVVLQYLKSGVLRAGRR